MRLSIGKSLVSQFFALMPLVSAICQINHHPVDKSLRYPVDGDLSGVYRSSHFELGPEV